jgi:oligogalacturonide lyase
MIQAGAFHFEHLVNLARHDYSLEPNNSFTPDGKWIVFRSNMRGPIQVYAVEVARAQ